MKGNHMRAYVKSDADTPARLQVMDRPSPGPGQVELQISACGLNHADLLMLNGRYQDTPPLPFVPGMEVCGRVTNTGLGVSDIAIGTRVAAFVGHGGLAEHGVFDASRCVMVPQSMSDAEAAGFVIAYGTSHVALTHKVRLQPAERLLVLGAAGGVGLTAVEIGAALGAEVIACARGSERLAVAKAAGAQHLIDSDSAILRDQVKALGGADVVYDAVGGDLFTQALRATNPDGRILLIGFASGKIPEIKANHLLVKNISVHGLYWGGYLKTTPKIVTDSLSALFDLYRQGKLCPHISHILPLNDVEAGLDLLRTRRSTGKVVVTMT